MGKASASLWLTAVKRAFRSSTKDTTHSRRTTDDNQPLQDDDNNNNNNKRKEKRRWLFRKSSSGSVQQKQVEEKKNAPQPQQHMYSMEYFDAEEKHPISMAAPAPAPTLKLKAAAEIIRLTTTPSSISLTRHFAAAIIIQTAFRGYLARRALQALKGIVMLQAVIRGQNVRKQATITLKCMQALLRVQSRINDDQRCSRLSHDGARKSMFAEAANFWDSKKYLQDIRHGRSMSREGSCIPDDWSDHIPRTLEELDAILQSRKEANVLREISLANALPQQIWKSSRNASMVDEKEFEERASWLDRWMEAKQWENQRRSSRASLDTRDSIKTVEIDNTSSPYYSRSATSTYCKSPYHASHYIPNSPVEEQATVLPSLNNRSHRLQSRPDPYRLDQQVPGA